MVEAEELAVYAPAVLPGNTRPPEVAPARPGARRHKGLVLAGVAFLGLMGLAVVGQAAVVAVRGYEVQQLEAKAVALSRSNDRLELEISRLRSPEQVALAARERLGMVSPAEAGVAYVQPGPVPAAVAVTPSPPLLVAEKGKDPFLRQVAGAIGDRIGKAKQARAAENDR
ncbi:MAG: hypothetical protein D9V47_01255 [Clostridia bacterium]|nr:MAG: hypothetical protein D9V47_01255 [Clostridia bacterium]